VSLDVQVREVGDQGQQAGVGAHHLRGPPPLHVSDPGIYNKYSLRSGTESVCRLGFLIQLNSFSPGSALNDLGP
jgi:hypothetical protein